MITLGMLIDNRYEILEKIGTGGMADVYRAKDQKLNRYVAVKILKQEYSENKNFVSKFRVEAQAAAGLLHPNIVNVYDVGEEDGIHYIVMELVEGITLKKYIEKKVRLSTKEAISIAIQVAMGIEAAHNNHIIHRDIKPQNIIISREGKVKVTDFGIAKAASSNTITSNVMGSVHYSSPEQARGGFSDEKSDIYSMGITMFEMLTGRVPFNGDTTVSIAIKHIQDDMPSPRSLVPEIPVSVEGIVLKCTMKNPDRRYQNMGEVIRDLKHSLISPDENFVQLGNANEIGKTRVVDKEIKRETYYEEPYESQPDYYEEPVKEAEARKTGRMEQEKKPVKNNASKSKSQNVGTTSGKSTGNKKNGSTSKKATKTADTGKIKARTEEYEGYDEDYNYNPKAERITTILTVIAAIIIGCIIIYFAGQAVGIFSSISTKIGSSSSESVERATMPEFEGLPLEEVKAAMKEVGLGVKTTYVESSKYDKDIVMAAAIEETGEEVKKGYEIVKNTTVLLTVSAGKDGIPVPSVVGMSEAEGTATLTAESFVVEKASAYSTEYSKGTIISQSIDENSVAALGTTITIVISMGSESVEVRVPEVTGKDTETAVSLLEEEGLVVGDIDETYSAEYPEGQICYQSYAAGTMINQGAIVDLKVSIGAETASYSCNLMIQAPADYTSGNAEIILTTADGSQQLWYSQNVTSFPVAINLSNFQSSSAYGVVTISYLKNVEKLVTDSDGNPTTQVVQEIAQETQNVTFTKE